MLTLKKWNEKTDKLTVVVEASNVQKLAPGDYTGLFEVLKKMLGDPHASVSQSSVRAIVNLAKGLRENFHDLAL